MQQLQTQADAADCTVFLLTNPTEQKPSSEETMVDGIINLGTTVHEWRSARELCVRKFRGSGYLQGVHSYDITEDGITVYPRLETLITTGLGPQRRTKENFVRKFPPRCDAWRRIARAFVDDGDRTVGNRQDHFGPAISGAVERRGAGSAVRILRDTGANPHQGKCDLSCALLKQLDAGHVQILWQAPTDQFLDEIADRMLRDIKQRKVKRLLIDGLGGFKKALRSRPIEPFFSALVHELRAQGVTSICTAEVMEIVGPTMTVPLQGLSDVTDNHILLRFIETGASLYRLLSILKVRDSAFDSDLRELHFAASGLELAENSASAKSILLSASRKPGAEVTQEK